MSDNKTKTALLITRGDAVSVVFCTSSNEAKTAAAGAFNEAIGGLPGNKRRLLQGHPTNRILGDLRQNGHTSVSFDEGDVWAARLIEADECRFTMIRNRMMPGSVLKEIRFMTDVVCRPKGAEKPDLPVMVTIPSEREMALEKVMGDLLDALNTGAEGGAYDTETQSGRAAWYRHLSAPRIAARSLLEGRGRG